MVNWQALRFSAKMTEGSYSAASRSCLRRAIPGAPPAGALKRVQFCSRQNCRIEVDVDGELTDLEVQREND